MNPIKNRLHPVAVMAVALAALSGCAVAGWINVATVTEIAIYVLYGLGVNLMLGYTGLVPFGASVFFGTATYAAAITARSFIGNEIGGLAVAIVFSALLGVALGAIVLLRRGLYFSLLTLACSQIAFEIAFKWTDVTGGENGLQNVPRPMFPSADAFHVMCVVIVLVVAWLLWRLAHSPLGRSFQAIRENEARAASLGYDVYRLKLASFTIAGVVIGAAGGLLAFLIQGAYANNLNWQHAGDAVLANVLGGVHHFLGPLWGALTFILLKDHLSGAIENWWLVFAPIVIILAIFSPQGLHGLAQRLMSRSRYTLVRDGVPPLPQQITPYRPGRSDAEASAPLLEVRKLSRNFGALVTAKDIDLQIFSRGLHSLIGPNGAGKTTFFNMLSGVLPPSGGQIFFRRRDITGLSVHERARLGIGRSFQIVRVFPQLCAFENVRIAVQASHPSRHSFFRDAYALHDVNEQTWSLLAAVGLEGRAQTLCMNLSHGEQRLLEIAVTLACDAKVLLFDEPLAGLAEQDRRVVTDLLVSLARDHAVFLVEHDIDRVLSVSDRITVLHQGKLIADGPPDAIVNDPAVIAAYLGKSRDKSAAPAVASRGDVSSASRSTVLELQGVVGGYEGSRVLDGLSLRLREGEVVALLGRNGVGKTTALRAILGACTVNQGTIHLDGTAIQGLPGHQINRRGIAIVPQGRRLFPNLTVEENLRVAVRVGGATLAEAYDLFPKLGVLKHAKAQNLSGGERQMVAIARALMAPCRVILLDEPFEGLAPAVVNDIMEAIVRLRSRSSLIIVEHDADAILSIADRAYILVNGAVAFEGDAAELAARPDLQARYLGIAHGGEVDAKKGLAAATI
jgi:branched-chain amino acid transport system ATP-binding protein